jgi:hypothetical protein
MPARDHEFQNRKGADAADRALRQLGFVHSTGIGAIRRAVRAAGRTMTSSSVTDPKVQRCSITGIMDQLTFKP